MKGHEPLLTITRHAIDPRALLEPVSWIVLEELALEATLVDNHVIVEHSARSLGQHMGRSRDSVARAFRQLVAEGLIERAGHRNYDSGRFTGVHYVLDLDAAGLQVHSLPEPAPEPEAPNLGPTLFDDLTPTLRQLSSQPASRTPGHR